MEKQIRQVLSQLIQNPSDIQAMYDLERLFGEHGGKWSELGQLLSARAEQAPTSEMQAQLLVRAGEVVGLKAGDAEGAEALLGRAVVLGGKNVESDVQVVLLSLKGDWRSVIEIYQSRLTEAETDSDKVDLLCRMGFVFRDQLGDAKNSMKAFQSAFRMDRTCLVALQAAREIYAGVGNWKLVAQLLQFEIQAHQARNDARGVAGAFVALGDALREHLEQPDIARNCYSNALKIDADSIPAQNGIRLLDGLPPLEEDAASDSVDEDSAEEEAPLPVLEGVEPAEETEEPATMDVSELDGESSADSIDVDAEVAEVEEAVAEEAVEEAPEAEEAPADEEADVEVDVDLDEDEEEAADVEGEEAPAEEAAEDDIEVVAEVEEEAAEEVEEVAEEASDEAAEEAAEEEAVEETAEVEDGEAPAEEAAEDDIEVVAEAEEAAEEAPEAAEEASDEAEEAAEDAAEEVAEDDIEVVAEVEEEAAEEVEEVAEEASDEAVEEAVEEPAEEEAVAEAPAEEAAEEEAPAEDVAVVEEAAEEEAAAPVEPQGEDWQGKIDAFVAALDAAPDDDTHYESIRNSGGDKAAWEALAGQIEARRGAGDATGAIGRQLGRIRLYELGDVEGAQALAESLQSESNAGTFVQEVADARTASGGSWRRLQQELGSRNADLSKADGARGIYGRIAEIARALGHDDRRLDALRHLVQDAPEDSAAREELKAIYKSQGKWQNYIELLKQEVEQADSEDGKKAILWEMVGIYRDELKLDVMVINTLNQVLALDPGNTDVLDQLAAQYEKMRRFPDLVGILQKRAEAAQTDEEKISVHLRVANLFLEKFNNQAEAIKAFEAIAEIDPYHPDALTHLKGMYEKRREYEKLIDIHQREIEQLEDPAEKGSRYKEIAQLATKRLRKPERAMELWSQVLAFAPQDLEALEALESIYERSKDWEKLAAIGEAKIELLEDDKAKIKLAEKMGRLYGDRLHQPEDAARCWRRVLAIDPANRRALDSLKRLLIDAQDWDALEEFFLSRDDAKTLVRTLETLANTNKDEEVKIELFFRSARVWREEVGQTDRAVRSLEKIRELDEHNARAAGMLAPIYEEAGDWRKLALSLETILSHLDPVEDRAATLDALSKLARINEEQLSHPEVAFLYYSKAFALTELSSPAASEPSAPEAVEGDEEGAESDAEDTGEETGEEAGEEAAEAASDEDAEPAGSPFDDLERVAESLGSWDELVGVYSDKLDVVADAADPEPARELRLRLGRVLHKELGHADEALSHYENVLAAHPDELRALSAQEEIFSQTGDSARLMEVYDRKLALTADVDERVGILLSKATILDEYRGEPREAVECYLLVLEQSPDHPEALGNLHRLYEGLEDYVSLAGIIRREVALREATPLAEVKAVDGQPMTQEEAAEAGALVEGALLDELVLLKLQLGLVAASALPEAEARSEAVEAFRDVLAVQPDNEDALGNIEVLGSDADLALRVSNILEPLYAEAGHWERLVSAREVQLGATPYDDVEARGAKLLSIGETLVTQISDFDRGFDAYGRALREQPTSEPARERLEQIADATGDWGPLVDLMEGIIPDLTDPELTHGYQTRVALAIEGQLHDSARAQDAWRRVLDLEPEDWQALTHLEELTMDGQQWVELDGVYNSMLSILRTRQENGEEVGGDIQELLFKQAMLHEEMLEDAAGAIEIYRTIVDTDPRNLRAARSMDRLLAGEGRFDELSGNLEQQLALVEEPEERRDLKCRLANLQETHLFQIPEAVGLYGEVLGEDPANAEALGALERLIQAEADHQLPIADVLEPIYENGEQWDKLVETLEIRLAATEDPEARVGLLHRISGLHESQRVDPYQSFATMRRALAEDIHRPESMDGLYRLAAVIEGWDPLVDALEEEVARAMDPDLAGSLNMRIAALQENNLGDVAGATEHYRRVLESQPENIEAINHLERIYQDTAQWQELVEILLRKVPLTEDEPGQKQLLYQAATLYEEMLERTDDAIETFERVLHIDEADPVAIEQLERLYRESQRWIDLIELYQRKLGQTEDPAVRRDLHFLVGGLYEAELQDSDKAIETYRQVLEHNPDDRDALRLLDTLYQETQQYGYLQETLERQLQLAETPEDSLALRHRIGALWEIHLGDPLRAVEVYKGILEEAPDFAVTLEALEGMVERREEQVAAADVLRPIYRNTEQWPRLIELYEILVESGDDDPQVQAGLLKEIGQIQELRLEDRMSAFSAYGRSLALSPEDEGVLETLERLASELEIWEALVDLLEERLGDIHDMEIARGIALRIGRILEEEIFDRPRAIDRFRMVLDFDPTDQTAIKSLDRLYEQEGRWQELAGVLQDEILQEEDENEQVSLRFRLGKLYEAALEDTDQAIATYQEILMGQPEHQGALESLEGMFAEGKAPMEIGGILAPWYEERGQWENLVNVNLVQLEERDDPDERFMQLLQIAQLYREKLQNDESAFVVMGSALAERPGDEETIEQIEALGGSLDAWNEVAGFYADALDRSQNPDDQRRLLARIARIMDENLGDVAAAEQAYLRVLEMDDTEQSALGALDRIYAQQARWPELAEIIQREIELSLDEEKVVQLSYRLGMLFEHQLGDLDRAVATYNNLLDIQPQHPEALRALEGIYQNREEWEPLFNIYERQADLLEEDQGEQSNVFAKMASLADQMLMRPLDAIDLWNRVLDLKGEDLIALQSLSQLHAREGQHGELVSVLEREVRATADPERQVALLSYTGEIWRDHLLNDDRALESYRQVLAIEPTNVKALYACRDLYQRLGDYESLVGVVDQLIMEEALGRDEQLELYIQLGEIQGNLLRNLDEAVAAWTAVLALEPTHKLALDSLEELYSEQGQHEACVNILERKVEVLESAYVAKWGEEVDDDNEEAFSDPMLDEQIELQLRIADLWENKISRQDQAVAAYEGVLLIDPGHMQASRALEGLYNDQGEWQKLVELYLIRQEYTEDTFEGLEILRNAARIYEEKLDDKESAFLVLCRAFMESSDDEQVAMDLERLARSTGQWETLINLYYNVLEGMEDSSEAMLLHVMIARWCADEMGDRPKAIDHYQKALELAPDNTDVMGALEAIYQQDGRWEDLVQIVDLRAAMTPEDDVRIELHRKAGMVFDEQLEDPTRAIDAYHTVLHIDPTDVAAMEALERIHERQQAWPELIQVLERKSEVIFEPDQVVEIKHRIAQLWESKVGSIERAVDAYRGVLGIEATHMPSLEALERLYRHLEKWYELQEVYGMQLNLAQEPGHQVEIYAKSAQVFETEMGDVESAVESWGRVLLVDPHNLMAIGELERLYTDLQRWDDLYQTLERHVESVMDDQTRVDLYVTMGQVCKDQMHDLSRAIEAYRRVLEIDPQHVEGLGELAGLYEMASDWESCLAVYERLSQVVTDPEAGVEIHYRMGRIKAENLLDQAGAEERYRFALDIDPSYMPAIEALRQMYEQREDWSGMIAMLKQQEEFTRDLEQKAALLCHIGNIYEHRLGDEIRALDYYEQTIDLAPENVTAAEPLAAMYLREQRWARAWPLLDLLVRHYGHDHSREDLFQLHYNLGRCCEELGQEDRALREYGESYERNPNHLPTLMGMARLMYKRDDLDRAYKIFRTVTRHHTDALGEEELTDIYVHCGDIKRRLGEVDAAIEMYEASLQHTPDNKQALEALVDLNAQAGRWEHVIAYRQRLLEALTEPIERYAALVEMGDILGGQLGNSAAAVEVYRQALDTQPDSVAVLRKLLDIYTQAQMWTDAVAVLSRIADLEQDPGRASKYNYTIAVIYRDEVGDALRSVEFFNRALDHDVTMLKAFEAIDRILTSEQAWKELERSYRKMLHRVKDLPSSPEMNGLKLLLWKNLGEIYRSRQANYEAAIEAYKVAGALQPDDHKIHEILADLYERSGQHPEEAIIEHKRLIAMKPFRIESYRALFKTYMETQRYDEAWCMASALTFLNSAEPKEQEFYQTYLGDGPASPNRPLTPDQWKLVYHTEQDMIISNIMALIAVYMRKPFYAFDHKTWALHKRKDLLQPNPQMPFWRIYQLTAQSLGVNPPPHVYLKRDQMAPMRNGNLEPPAFIVGNTLLQGGSDREVAYIVGKQLSLARPEHYLASGFFPTENLKVLFMAAMQLTNPQLGLARDPNVANAAQAMQKVPPPVLIQLRKFMQQFFNAGQNPNLSAWLKAVDFTTDRVGLLMCGDLIQAANAIKNEQLPISKLTVKEKIKELVLFSISEEYFQLRRELGLALRSS